LKQVFEVSRRTESFRFRRQKKEREKFVNATVAEYLSRSRTCKSSPRLEMRQMFSKEDHPASAIRLTHGIIIGRRARRIY